VNGVDVRIRRLLDGDACAHVVLAFPRALYVGSARVFSTRCATDDEHFL
jgi:hypothetical protein